MIWTIAAILVVLWVSGTGDFPHSERAYPLLLLIAAA